MKILLNPDAPKGAPIKDFTINGTEYFSEKNDELPFESGNIFQFEDDNIANEFLDHFGFLMEMDPEDAKKFMETEKQTCDKCDFSTRVKTQMERHMQTHAKAQELSDLGIPMIRKKRTLQQVDQAVVDMQKSIDAEDTRDGLEGAGLVDDRPQKNVIMS